MFLLQLDKTHYELHFYAVSAGGGYHFITFVYPEHPGGSEASSWSTAFLRSSVAQATSVQRLRAKATPATQRPWGRRGRAWTQPSTERHLDAKEVQDEAAAA